MDRNNRNSAIAAFVILVVFAAFAYYLPAIMLAVGRVSGILAVAVVVVFMLGLFVLLWLRSRVQAGRDRRD